MRAAAPLALIVLALVPAGCGNEEVAKQPKHHARTERTEPLTDTAPATTPQAAPQAPSSTAQDPATAPAPQGEGNGSTGGTPQGGTDSPQHDTPPPKGSPAERFEQKCRSQPKTCG
jgi:hypothetical protein